MWEEYFSEIIGAETLSWDEGFVCFEVLTGDLKLVRSQGQ